MKETRYKIGDVVYLKTDVEQLPRLVTGILMRHKGFVWYYLAQGITETCHTEIEISPEKNIVFQFQN